MAHTAARRLALFLVVNAVPLAASGDKLQDCLNSASTQRAMERCAHGAFLEVQKDLEIVYRGHMDDLDSRERAAGSPEALEAVRRTRQFLQDSQEAWLKYRTANCNLHVADVWEGTMMTLARELCYVRMTRDRIADVTRAFEPP